MHALTLTFDDADTLTASCKAIMDGKDMPEKPTTLKRMKQEGRRGGFGRAATKP